MVVVGKVVGEGVVVVGKVVGGGVAVVGKVVGGGVVVVDRVVTGRRNTDVEKTRELKEKSMEKRT